VRTVTRDKTRRRKCDAKGRRKGAQKQEFMFGGKRNVEYEMYDHTGNNWSHRNSNKRCKEKCGSHTRKTFNIFTTKDSYTCNITHNTESTAVWNSKPERWGSALVQGDNYQGQKDCDKIQHVNNIIKWINMEGRRGVV